MKLSELEDRARQEQEEAAALAAEQKLEEQIAAAEAAEEFRQRVIAWMAAEGDLDPSELEQTLIIADLGHMKIQLSVKDHTVITFRLQEKEDGNLEVQWSRFEIQGQSGYAASLGFALAAAADAWREYQEREERDAQREAQRQARYVAANQEAAERGQGYLDMLDDHPILRPILDILGSFVEERERFAADLEMAENLTVGIEAHMFSKLEQAQYEAKRADEERERLQRDLWWDEQRKARQAERKRGQ